MAPSLVKKIGAAVACAGAVRAATETYQLSEEYTADNFFDKFDFFVSTYTSDDSWDLTHGFVEYLSQTDAQSLGLISTTSDGQMYIGPDINSTYDADGKGRSSVRMTSKATYNQGLMIAKFSHMPVQACGAWPAFWSYGSPWLTMGEIDYFEGWDLMGYNRMAMHTNETLAGSCLLSESGISGTVLTQQCNNNDTGTGCGVQDDSGVWGSVTGATFAMEWTDSAIKIWSWIPTSVPADVTAGTPDPSSSAWGNPTLLVEQDNCDLSKSFANQQLVFDIDFCGDTAGSSTIWDATCSAFGDSCSAYVAENPLAFAETYFMVEGIQFYELGAAAASSTVSIASSTSVVSVASSTSIATSASSSVIVAISSASSTAVAPTTTSTSEAGGLLAGTGSVLLSTLGSTPTGDAAAVITSTHSHSTGYIYATSVSTDETGSETTIVLTVDTTICPITAAEASSSAAAAASSSAAVVEAQTTPSVLPPSSSDVPSSSSSAVTVPTTTASQPGAAVTSHITQYLTSTLSATHYSTSTIFSTSSSTITSCASDATTACSVGDVTTVVIAVSTTICPVTATETSGSSPVDETGAASRSTTYYLTLHSTFTQSSSSAVTESTAEAASTSKTVTASKALTTASSKAPSTFSSATATTKKTTVQSSATTEVISATDMGGALETATAAPTSISLDWLTETAAAAAGTGFYSASNATVTSGASTTGGAAAASKTSSCAGLDCIVVSSSGVSVHGGLQAGGIALVAIAAGVALLV